MTNVTFIGNKPTKESKHIELVKIYTGIGKPSYPPEKWQKIDLVAKKAKDGLDVIVCHDNGTAGTAYLGHWNDGTTSNPETVCTVLGEDVAVKKGKGIEFKQYLSPHSMRFLNSVSHPHEFKNIEVICVNHTEFGESLFFAFNDNRDTGSIYLGHLNDGFVE